MSFELLEQASARWDRLVEEEYGTADQLANLNSQLAEQGITAGGRPLCTVLRPHLITEEMLTRQSRAAGLISSALFKVLDVVVRDEELHQHHLGGFMDWIGDLIRLEVDPVGQGTLMRLDASLARTRLHFIEMNADAPGGAGHHDSIVDLFEGLETFGRFRSEYRVRPLRLIPHLVETMSEVWQDWGGSGVPEITIVTKSDDLVNQSSLEVEAEGFRRHGLDAVVCDYRDLSFEGERLTAGDRPVELLYRMMPIAMCQELGDEMEPLYSAVAAGAVCMVNPFRSELLGHKALFALLSDLSAQFGFSPAEREAVRDHVPWTRRLLDGKETDPGGTEVDLTDYVVKEREHLVLKPAHQFAGRGVVLGWQQDDGAWRSAVEEALAGDFVVQRRVSLHRIGYPTIDAPGARGDFFEDTDPFLFRGQAGGLLTRLSRSEITNVHSGGSVAASFAIAPRAASE